MRKYGLRCSIAAFGQAFGRDTIGVSYQLTFGTMVKEIVL